MNKNDIDFLKNLQHEMLTQDTVAQADPRFWVVMEKRRIYGINDNYSIDGIVIIDTDGEKIESDISSLYGFLHDELDIDCRLDILSEQCKLCINVDDKILKNTRDVMDYIEEYTSYDKYSLVNYREEDYIAEDTMFLTLRECKEHIKRNGYHYNKPRPYAMTAWRSPQVERLYKILQETNWNELKEEN